MRTPFSFFRVSSYLTLLFALLLLVLPQGCTRDDDRVIVDFSKTLPGERTSVMSTTERSLNVAVGAMISPKETFVYYRQILDYIGRNLDREVKLIQRKTYGEINELFRKGNIDLAFICSGPYALGKEKYGFELLSTPQVHGSHFYQSYLIVKRDSPFHKFEDLRGRVFAFTDPDSNTGRLVPTYWLAQVGERPETYFSKTIYTYSHDNSIMATAKGLVDGASIDGLIWEYYHLKDPTFTSQTRIIRKSEPYGIPPLVVSRNLSPEIKERIRQLVFSMHKELDGQKILAKLMIDRFIEPEEEWYSGIRGMVQTLAMIEKKTDALSKP